MGQGLRQMAWISCLETNQQASNNFTLVRLWPTQLKQRA